MRCGATLEGTRAHLIGPGSVVSGKVRVRVGVRVGVRVRVRVRVRVGVRVGNRVEGGRAHNVEDTRLVALAKDLVRVKVRVTRLGL